MAKRKPARNKTTADPRALMAMMAGKWVSQAVSVAVELGLPDRGPLSVVEGVKG